MKVLIYVAMVLSLGCTSMVRTQSKINEEYQSLFDGKTLNGWRMAQHDSVPGIAWSAENGEISFDPTKGHGSDIITTQSFKDFDLP